MNCIIFLLYNNSVSSNTKMDVFHIPKVIKQPHAKIRVAPNLQLVIYSHKASIIAIFFIFIFIIYLINVKIVY